MVSVDKAVIARLVKNGETFEVLVDPDKALAYRKGSPVSIDNILATSEIFKDSKKGDRPTATDLDKAFGKGMDFLHMAEKIIKEGEIQLTTEQRRKLTEEKRKAVADLISKYAIDPKSKLPHPPQRITNAMEQAHVHVDPFKSEKEQMKDIIDMISPIIPISVEKVDVAIRIPLEHAGRAEPVLRRIAQVKKEEWTSTSWIVVIEIPAGMQADIYARLNDVTKGSIETKIIGETKL
ncbi:MAG: ribosome assembly factor SBDS [Candidatus Aenigmarchaeota archaeon]|nr:ribosome assembly factor SBDS [Candidatus Aenigmarchaeota archaeon]